MEDLLNRFRNKKYFTKLDMAQGYYPVPESSDSIDKTAFETPDEQFEFIRMHFGLSNAPATFQRLIDKLLGKLQFDKVIVYLDAILIPSNNVQEGLTLLGEVLKLFY